MLLVNQLVGFGVGGRDYSARIPVMTSNSAGGITLSASSVLSAGQSEPWAATDTSNLAYPHIWHSGNAAGQWWKIDFGYQVAIYDYLMAQRTDDNAYQMSGWDLHGSLDDSSWTLLHQVTGKTWGVSGMSEAVLYTITSPGTYRYYRVTSTAMENSTNYGTIGYIQMYS